jgi:gas vesicle protein
MAKRKDTETTAGSAAADPIGPPAPKSVKRDLPTVESPPLSPASEAVAPIAAEPSVVETTAPETIPAATTIDPPIEPAAVKAAELSPRIWPRFTIRPRHKRYGVLAASVTFAAALGAVIGALASSGSAPPSAKSDVAAIEQTKTMQQSIAKLNKEIAALKTNLDQASKTAHTQIAKISDRLEHQAAEITGSIAPPQTIGAAPMAAQVPLPRPAQRLAVEPPPAHIPVVTGWTIHDFRNGYVFVANHGEVYQAQLGAPLPGLGPVQSIKRQDGRWMVLTPRGIIVSMRDRRYFEEF